MSVDALTSIGGFFFMVAPSRNLNYCSCISMFMCIWQINGFHSAEEKSFFALTDSENPFTNKGAAGVQSEKRRFLAKFGPKKQFCSKTMRDMAITNKIN